MYRAVEVFSGALSQVFVSAVIPTRYGDVELYGYIDELVRDTVYDIKTTSKYDLASMNTAGSAMYILTV